MSHEKYKICIDACYDCATMCKRCIGACLEDPDVKMLSRCIKLNNHCAGICKLTATVMAGGNEYINEFCRLCAFICDNCAGECVKHSQIELCGQCAEACDKCADECRDVIRMSKVQVA